MAGTAADKKGNRLTIYIFVALTAGIVAGLFLNRYYINGENIIISKSFATIDSIQQKLNGITDTTSSTHRQLVAQKAVLINGKAKAVAAQDKKLEPFSLLADIFLRLIKMIVAPLVFTTLVVGIAKQGDMKAVGRIGGKALLWFISASFVSLLLGMLLVNYFKPGASMHLPLPELSDNTVTSTLTLHDFINHMFPTSIFDAMAKNEILQVVVFALFFGIAATAAGEYAAVIIKALDAVAHIILKMVGYIMKFAPLAVFGAMTATIARQGAGILETYSKFVVEFYIGLGLLFLFLVSVAFIVIRKKVFLLLKHIKEPAIIAFSTNSSEAAFPKTMLELERFGCDEKIVSFVLPLGYSFNLDGSMMYLTFASLFVAQAYGIHLDFGTQLSMFLVLMLTSKGVAGVPRSVMVVLAGTFATFKLPEAGIALLLGIDPLMDMGRASMNVIGNSIATAVVSKWEKSLSA